MAARGPVPELQHDRPPPHQRRQELLHKRRGTGQVFERQRQQLHRSWVRGVPARLGNLPREVIPSLPTVQRNSRNRDQADEETPVNLLDGWHIRRGQIC